MKHRNLWLGTALAGLLIGISSHADAQEYFRFKPSGKPAVEIDMSLLDSAPEPAAKPKSDAPKVAEYQYLRSPAIEEKAPEPAAAPPIQEEATEPKPVVAVPPTPPPDDAPRKTAAPVVEKKVTATPPKAPNKPSLTITNEPAPKRKSSLKVVNEPAPAKPKPSVEITSKPEPAPVPAPVIPAKPAPAVPANAIISQPPRVESAVPRVDHRDLHQLPPIISSPPDAKAPRPVQEPSVPAPAAAPVAPVEAAPAPDIDYMRGSDAAPKAKEPSPAIVSAPVAGPARPAPAPTQKIISTPEPAIVSTPVPAPAPRVVEAPVENRPVSNPLPDITVVHEADNPEVSEPAPIAQPAPRPRGPRDEPPTLPQSGKPGHSTIDSIPAFAQAARPVPTTEPVPQTSASPPAPFEAASAAAPVAAPPAVQAPPEEISMPVVPTMADLTLAFPGNSSDLTTETQKKLDSVIRQMKDMGEGRLQVRGFAAGEDGNKSSARRIALSRALSVRSYLLDKGIKATRVDVRAMGTETDRSPLDRVDLIFAR